MSAKLMDRKEIFRMDTVVPGHIVLFFSHWYITQDTTSST